MSGTKVSNKILNFLIPMLLLLLNILGVTSASTGERTVGDAFNTTSPNESINMNFTHYHSYEEMTEYLQSVARKRPDISVLHSIGTTYEGRDIWALKISDNPSEYEPEEPEVLYIGMHHAREWISHEIPLYFIDYIVNNYGRDPRTTFVVNNRQMWIVPMLNPDGYVYDGNGDYSNRHDWRKNREPNWDGSYGTDLNRNYGWHWGEVGYQGYANPRREDYIGPYDTKDDDGDFRLNEDPMDGIDNDGDGKIDEDTRGGFSTAETRIIRDLAIEHDFKISMSYHSYAETIYWGYMYTRQLPPDEQLYKHIAEGIHRFNGYECRNYTEDDRNRRGPLVDGDLNDYLYGEHGILSFCIEVGSEAKGGFYPPEDMIIPLCELNLIQNLYVAEIADNPWEQHFDIHHTPIKNVTDSCGPFEITATVSSTEGLELQSGGPAVRYSTDGVEFHEVRMESTGNPDEFCANIPRQSHGAKISYYIHARDSSNHITQSPKYAPFQSYNFTIRSEGRHANPVLTRIHGLFMMGTLVFFIIPAIFAGVYLKRKTNVNPTIMATILAVFILFIGGFPLGWPVAYQEYGVAWTGLPFGWDLVDNVTLILFLVWITPLILMRKNILASRRFSTLFVRKARERIRSWGNKRRENRIGDNTFAILVIVLSILSSVVMLALPHGS